MLFSLFFEFFLDLLTIILDLLVFLLSFFYFLLDFILFLDQSLALLFVLLDHGVE